ncbi:MAG TPA: MarR family winged helix-turn-helix transcriptional regulator [Amycolatopsis sp.]|nr:MarR family winged helix-turn-helix transcriptional regulator [Amycolatopsis sp.]
MSLSEDASLELMRQLRVAAQLQHAWASQQWQPATDGHLHPAAAALLSDLAINGESRPSELAKRRMVDISVVSRQIAQLSAAGLIERRPAPEDGRASLVSVSEAGAIHLKRWRQNHLDFIRGALHDWTDDDVTALTERLQDMNDALRAAVRPADPMS